MENALTMGFQIENKTMIRKDICEKILVIGIDYRVVRGGVAAVENVYSTFYKPFNFVRTVVDGNKVVKLLVFIEALFHFLYYMLFSKIEIIHIHGASYASFWRKRIFIYTAKFFGKKIVYHIHGGGFGNFADKKDVVYKTLLKCDRIVVLSEYWKEYFMNNFGLHNVIIIKNVIAQPAIAKVEHEEFTLLFLGLLVKEKGIYDLIELLSEYKEKYERRVRLIVGGNGDVKSFQNKIQEYGLENIISFEGWVSGEKKSRLFNSSDVYVLPSYTEGLPISILEAMSYKLPIISTNVGGIPEIVFNNVNGFLITPGDKEAIVKSIDALLGDMDKCKEMGEQSELLVKEHLPAFVEKQLETLYKSMLNLPC